MGNKGPPADAEDASLEFRPPQPPRREAAPTKAPRSGRRYSVAKRERERSQSLALRQPVYLFFGGGGGACFGGEAGLCGGT
jgi:hypothetical protein